MKFQFLLLLVFTQACGGEQIKNEYDWKTISDYVKNQLSKEYPPDTFFAPRDHSKIINTPDGMEIYMDRIALEFDFKNPSSASTLDKIVKELNAIIISSLPVIGSYKIQVNTTTYEELKVIVDKLNNNTDYPALQGACWVPANIEKYMIFEHPLPQGKKKVN
ncbi:MAG: hypothetical protein JXR95_03500 [Deltaproteobacteria bacterium]|nr:hypothetical protein [Deltaproteobacteria bacterium]